MVGALDDQISPSLRIHHHSLGVTSLKKMQMSDQYNISTIEPDIQSDGFGRNDQLFVKIYVS